MTYVFLIILIIVFIILLFLFPFKITIFNQDKYLYIKVSGLITLKLNIYSLFDNANIDELKKQSKSLKLIKKLKFKEIDIYLRGFNYNYSINGAYYGIINAILPILENLLESNDIQFNYLIDYDGELYIKFKSVVRAKFINVIKGFYGI